MTKSDFEKLRVYQLAEMLAAFVWEVDIKGDRLAQDTIGKQLINSADSIGANIAEGAGRGSFADNKRFVRIAKGSLFEVRHWLRRAYNRKLLSQAEVVRFRELIDELTPKLSAYIKSIGKQGKTKPQPALEEIIASNQKDRQQPTDHGQRTTDE